MNGENNHRHSISSEAIGPLSPALTMTPITGDEYELPEVDEKIAQERALEIHQQIEEERAHLESLRIIQQEEAEKALEQNCANMVEQKRLAQLRLELEQKRAAEEQALANNIAVARSFGL
jgi:hypothetical protein